MIIPLGSVFSLDPQVVGHDAAVLSRALRLGLPVAGGFAVPIGADVTEGPRRLNAMRQAWTRLRGPVRLAVSVSSPSGEGFGTSAHFHNGSTWRGLLDGLCDVLAHHRLENPFTRLSPCAVVVQRVPAVRRSALVMSGHPTRRSRRPSIWTRVSENEDPRETMSWLRRLELRGIAHEAARLLSHPVDIEVVYDAHGDAWIVDCRSYGTAPWEKE